MVDSVLLGIGFNWVLCGMECIVGIYWYGIN